MSEWDFEVMTVYEAQFYPQMDKVLAKAVGRIPTENGMGYGIRDVGWLCKSESEAKRIASILTELGLDPIINDWREGTK